MKELSSLKTSETFTHWQSAISRRPKPLATVFPIYNSSVCSKNNINTRSKLKLHKPAARLTTYQRCVYYNSINIYNKLPDDLAELVSNKKCFLLELKKYLTDKPFYSVEEYFECIIDLWREAQGGNVHISVILILDYVIHEIMYRCVLLIS
jgi:hypothetical protein